MPNLVDVDIGSESQRADDDLTLGTSLRAYLRERQELLGTTDLANFFLHVRSFLSNLIVSARKRLPFDDTVISDISCLDPGERMSSTPGMMRRLSERF